MLRPILFFLILPLLALTGCEKDALVITEPSLAKAGNGQAVERAFKGDLVGTPPQVDFDAPCSLGAFGQGLAISADIAGNLTHLGKATGSYTGCGRPYFPGVPASIPGVIILDFTVVGAHGDELHGTVNFFSEPNPDDPALSDFFGTYTINGGTGRFTEAAGSGDITGFGPADPNSTEVPPTLQFDGSIIY